MADTRRHRGANPQDRFLFAADRIAVLAQAVEDLSWLQGHGYAQPSSVKIVGDRYDLTARQRIAVARAACSDEARADRLARRLEPAEAKGRSICVDGYNLLITVESALAGGVILACRDGTFRDLASIHGSYRSMTETVPALCMIGDWLRQVAGGTVRWLLDSPVSNSGRLKLRMAALAEENGWDWRVELHLSPDKELIGGGEVVVSSDSVVLDGCRSWLNLARTIIESDIPGAWVLRLG